MGCPCLSTGLLLQARHECFCKLFARAYPEVLGMGPQRVVPFQALGSIMPRQWGDGAICVRVAALHGLLLRTPVLLGRQVGLCSGDARHICSNPSTVLLSFRQPGISP